MNETEKFIEVESDSGFSEPHNNNKAPISLDLASIKQATTTKTLTTPTRSDSTDKSDNIMAEVQNVEEPERKLNF